MKEGYWKGYVMVAGLVGALSGFAYILYQDGQAQVAGADAQCAVAFRAASTPAESTAVIDKKPWCAYALARALEKKQ